MIISITNGNVNYQLDPGLQSISLENLESFSRNDSVGSVWPKFGQVQVVPLSTYMYYSILVGIEMRGRFKITELPSFRPKIAQISKLHLDLENEP